MSDYYFLITDAGKALEVAAHASGETVKLTEFAVGDGGGDPVTPDTTQTALVNEVFRAAISSLAANKTDASVLEAECVIPSSSGGYTIREIGIYADDGTLYATGNYADQDKPAPDSGFAASLDIFVELAVSDTSDIQLTVQDGSWLTETQADTIYLRQDKQLGEIADQGEEAQQEARDNLALGTAAVADLTESQTDTTVGRVLQTGDFGLGAGTWKVFADTDTVLSRTQKGVSFSRAWSADDLPSDTAYYNLIMMPEDYNGAFSCLLLPENNSPAYRGFGKTDVSWAKLFDTENPPTPTDVGAVPLNDDGSVDAIKELKCVKFFTPQTGTPFEFGHLSGVAGKLYLDFHTDGLENGEDYTVRITVNTDKSMLFTGTVVPGDYSNFDARYNGKYVQGVQLGAEVQQGGTAAAAGSCVTTVDGGESTDWVKSKTIQENVNGTWKVISG